MSKNSALFGQIILTLLKMHGTTIKKRKNTCFETHTVRVFATDMFTRQSKKQTQAAVPFTYSQSNASVRQGRLSRLVWA